MLRLAAALLLLVSCLPALAEQSHSRHAADQFGYVEAASLSRHAFNASQPACDEDVPGACAKPKNWQDVAWLKARTAWNFLFGTAERAIAVFTGLLALFSVLLWIYTKRAANAAHRAAEHIPAVERAYLFAAPAFIGANNDKTETTVEISEA